MIPKKLWERYFLKEFFTVFLLFLACLFTLFVVIDYTSRAGNQFFSQLQFKEIVEIYVFTYVQRLDILIPFALLVTTVKTLTTFNIRNELVALMASGVSIKRLMRPLISIGILCTLLLYLSEEFLLPFAYERINFLKDKYQTEKEVKATSRNIRSLAVQGQGLFLYHNFDAHKRAFFDAFWIRSNKEIYRIKYLHPFEEPFIGYYVDHFTRNEDQEIVLVNSYESKIFPKMRFTERDLRRSTILPEQEKLSHLARVAFEPQTKEAKAEARAALYHKLVMPLLALLAVMAPAPYCLRFTRSLPIFKIYLVSMLVMFTFYLIMNAALILGEANVLPPALAIFVPFGLYALFFTWQYSKLQ